MNYLNELMRFSCLSDLKGFDAGSNSHTNCPYSWDLKIPSFDLSPLGFAFCFTCLLFGSGFDLYLVRVKHRFVFESLYKMVDQKHSF